MTALGEERLLYSLTSSAKSFADVREIVSDVVNENVEKDWAQNTSLWDTADHRTGFRERRSNSY